MYAAILEELLSNLREVDEGKIYDQQIKLK